MTIVAGYDVGGAHLKVARVENGRLASVRQIACPLWQGLDQLDTALASAEPIVGGAAIHAITMTAELTEIFASREEAEEMRAQRIGTVARRFYEELPAALMGRGEQRSNLSARERASQRWKRTIH